ncbi:hypothetical protein IKF02_00190 [Candidatus Saccharibacteria bacterium]|nr:hypothetical protein [Candidatus Saccharibacteria bacterium]
MKNKLTKVIVLTLTFCGLFGVSTLPAFAEDCSDICSADCTSVPQAVKDAQGCNGANTTADAKKVVVNIINSIIGILGFIAVIFIVVGGVQYMTSTGDASKLKRAKDTILYACIGLIICVLSFAIVNFVIKGLLDSPGGYTSSSDCTNAGYTWNNTTGKCE